MTDDLTADEVRRLLSYLDARKWVRNPESPRPRLRIGK